MHMSEDLPWLEKYRPKGLDEVSGHQDVIATVRQFVERRQLPHLLFYGPPGTGKTSTIVAVAIEIYGPQYKNMVLELNASDERGIAVVQNQIKSFASTRHMFSSGFKLIILDEADSMTTAAQGALRRIIEKYAAHTRFCILANYVHKLIPALVSRCTRFRFSPLSKDAILTRVNQIAKAEHVKIGTEAVEAIASISQGDMRRAINVLQACHTRIEGQITARNIYECVGSPDPNDVEKMLHALLESDFSSCLSIISEIKAAKGLALADILTALSDAFIDLELTSHARGKILAGLADIEWRLSLGGSESLQLTGMVGAVQSSKIVT